MNFSKIFLWAAFLVIFAIMMVYSLRILHAGLPGIFSLEIANEEQGKAIIRSCNESGMIWNARLLAYYDFLALIFYVLLMISCSSERMNLEKNLLLNSLLRFNIVLAVITGLLDIAENIILLNNLRQMDAYINSFWITWPKFILAGWVVLVWLISIIKKMDHGFGAAASRNKNSLTHTLALVRSFLNVNDSVF